MELHYQRLTDQELDVFMDMRVRQLREEGAKEDIDLIPALRDHYQGNTAQLQSGEKYGIIIIWKHN